MKWIGIFSLLFLFPLPGRGQELIYVAKLAERLEESSGLIFLNGKLITHNDSGDEALLYVLDTVSGNVTRTVSLSNADNIDWEDICRDSSYIYIADFGNNNGNRKDLRVYRLKISDYLTTANDSVMVDTILFSYSDQRNFSPGPYASNFDAEAIIAYRDSLFIFTKNWGNFRTNIYALPKVPGNYQIGKVDSMNVQGLITGAVYDGERNALWLTGYTFTKPFIIEVSAFSSYNFSGGTIQRYLPAIPAGVSIQIESIAKTRDNQYYLTAEKSISGTAALYRFEASPLGVDLIDREGGLLFPNPGYDIIHLKGLDLSGIEIYDLSGLLRKTSEGATVCISGLNPGTYLLLARDANGKVIYTETFIAR